MTRLAVILLPILLLTGCFKQAPAPVSDKSGNKYDKTSNAKKGSESVPSFQTTMTNSVNNKAVGASNNEQVSETKLMPISESGKDFEPHKKIVMQRSEPIGAQEAASDTAKHSTATSHEQTAQKASTQVTHKQDSYKAKESKDLVQDLELEKQVDSKSAPEPLAQGSSSGSFKVASPLGLSSYQWPISGQILSRYGKTGNKFNEGLNIAAPLGTPVSAASDGKVVYVGNNVEGYGNLIILRHEHDLMTAYAHLADISVERGADIKRGATIGTVGKAGNVKEPQLHFSVRKGKKTVNPELPI